MSPQEVNLNKIQTFAVNEQYSPQMDIDIGGKATRIIVPILREWRNWQTR